jgi:predicted Rossmann fold flavoprotein
MTDKELIVIGGGAAGFFAAIQAAENFPMLKVSILEKSQNFLSKVRISGGGRCNITHYCFEPKVLATHYPRGSKFLRSLFYEFGPTETIAWFRVRGVDAKAEPDGRMFPTTDNSETVIHCLLNASKKVGITLQTGICVSKITRVANSFQLETNHGKKYYPDFLIVATGGAPQSRQLDWVKALGHRLVDPVPSLFTFNLVNPVATLMGVSVPAKVQIVGFPFQSEGPLLFTHWGFSGPAVLKLSAFAARYLNERQYTYTIRIYWLPQYDESALRESLDNHEFKALNQHRWHEIPKRLWEYLLGKANVRGHLTWSTLSSKEQNRLIETLTNDQYEAKGKTTFKEEFVTAGGLDLGDVNMRTMESKLHQNLFFAGEILDIDGVTGGFNFQAAWTTGYIAGKLGKK